MSAADPVREAAQALIDATDTIVPEHLTANEAMDWCEIDNAKVDAAWDALRTALAPTALHPLNGVCPVSGVRCGLGMDCSKGCPAAPEAPPPVEARQLLPNLDFKVLTITTAYEQGYGQGLDDRNLPNPYEPETVEFKAWAIGHKRSSRGAALASPAGAGEREALRELIAACDAQDEWRMTPTSLRMNLSAVEAHDIGNRVDLAWTAARAALSVSPPGPEIQPHLDHQVGAQVTPLPLESAGGAPSATAMEFEDIPACPGCGAMAGCCNDYPNCPGGTP